MGRERIVLVDTVGHRGISAAIPALLKFMAGDDTELRNAAIEALGMTVSPGTAADGRPNDREQSRRKQQGRY